MSILDLWVPILASAALVWIASALVWTVLPWHKKDYAKLPDEEAARSALKGLAAGQYMLPYCVDPKELENPELRRKFEEGPRGYITISPNGVPAMGGKLVKAFLYNVVVGIFCAYLLTRSTMMTDYMSAFRMTATVAFLAYSFANIPESTWFDRPWSLTFKNMFDALIYALLTGGVFGWLAV
jgi:hypothetical protein